MVFSFWHRTAGKGPGRKKESDTHVQMLSKGLERSPASVVITDVDGLIKDVDPKFEQMSGFFRKEIFSENPRVLKSGKTSDKVYRNLWETINKGDTWRGDFENKHKNGSPYYVAAQISPIHDAKEKISHFIGLQEDVTEKKELQKNWKKQPLQTV